MSASEVGSGDGIGLDSVVCWSDSPVATEVSGEVVLLNMERDRCYGLGVTGSAIWRRMRSPVRVSELSSQLEQAYQSAPGEIQIDLLRTLSQFAAEGLLQVRRADQTSIGLKRRDLDHLVGAACLG
jgi:hypothetical protein